VVDGGASASYAAATVGTTVVMDAPAIIASPEGGDAFALSGTGAYGAAVIAPSTGVITYTPSTDSTPAAGTTGTDTFTVTVTAGCCG